jgi:hypothetical protein
MKAFPMILRVILTAGTIFIVNPCISQKYFIISTGIGFPDNFNLKIMCGNQVQLGMSFGFDANFYDGSPGFGPLSAEVYYHFIGHSRFTNQKPWYTMGGLGYWWIVQEGSIFYTRIGRTLNITERFGFNLDYGAFFPLNEDVKGYLNGRTIWPSGNMGLFFRF